MAGGRDWEFVLMAGYGTKNWKWLILGLFWGWGERKALAGERGKWKQREKGWNRGEGSVGAMVGCLWG
jgi:hypothetical protein